jgi:seryl-tRNA synthetase
MAFKFLRIGTANAEIERQAVELATLTKERDELQAAIGANASETIKEAEGLQAKLAESKQSVEALTVEIGTVRADLAKAQEALAEAEKKLANPSAEIIKIASIKAAEITGAQGQPPIPAAPSGTPASNSPAASADDLAVQLEAIKDPTARTIFYRKHQAAILAAKRAGRS